MPKIIFYSEMLYGKHSRGGQKRRFKDILKSSLKSFDIKTDSWEFKAQERASWRSCIFNGAVSCEALKKAAAELRRKKWKAKELEPLTPSTIPCPHCPYLFRARIGLTSHLRVHKPS
jgi:hypothetical protein